MEITFYYAPMSSAVPVAAMLQELDVPHERKTFVLSETEHKKPDFLKINPNGKVPALVVDGTPMFEALAIMQWLGERFGVEAGLWPRSDSPEYLAATAWSTWAYVSYGQMVHQLWVGGGGPGAPAGLKSRAWEDDARSNLQQMLGVLDGHLAASEYIVGDRYCLADLIVCGVIAWSQMCGVSTADHPHVSRWREACVGRPALKEHFAFEG